MPSELIEHPALAALIGVAVVFHLCFVAAWIYIATRVIPLLKILFHMEKLGYRRSPIGIWTWGRAIEVIKTADARPTLGSAKMDSAMQKLRNQSDSPILGWLMAALALLDTAMAILVAIVVEQAIVVIVFLPIVIMFLAIYLAIRRFDKSWRCKKGSPSPQACTC